MFKVVYDDHMKGKNHASKVFMDVYRTYLCPIQVFMHVNLLTGMSERGEKVKGKEQKKITQ